MPFCSQCGNQVGTGDVYCATCGARQPVESRPPADPLAGVTPRTAAILCYIPIVGWIASIIELAPLSLSDARNYLQERAASMGRPNLFTPDALDLVIDGSRGLPRLMRTIAGHAFFSAVSQGASQIGQKHVSDALESRAV